MQKQSIIAEIQELTPGKRNGKALDQFTLEQLRTHLAKLMGETAPQMAPVASPVPRGEAKPTSLTLVLTFDSLEVLAAFCERMKESNHA